MDFNIQKNKNTVFLNESLPFVQSGDVDWLLLEGSSRSAKTWGILLFLISLALDPQKVGRNRLTIRAFRQDATTTAVSIVADFVEIMDNLFSYEDSGKKYSLFYAAGVWNKTLKTYTFSNGSTFSFHGASDAQKIQGGKQDIAWLNECMEIMPDSATQISMRTTLFKIADWNPSLTSHWVFKLIGRPNVRYCHSTYKDNCDLATGKSNLTPQIIRDIESLDPSNPENVVSGTADPFKWAVYGEGRRGAREGQVFPRIHWDVIDAALFPDKSACQKHGYGGDFGFSQDPTTLVDCRFHNDALYVRKLVYERGLLIGKNLQDSEIPSLQKRLEWYEEPEQQIYQFNRLEKQVWDNSDPRSIAFLRALGYNASGCVKGADSIRYGIALMKSYRIFICRSSLEIQQEFENYCYKKNPDGTFSDEPEDANNHAIDAIRYWVLDALKPRNVIGISPHRGGRAARRGLTNFYDRF